MADPFRIEIDAIIEEAPTYEDALGLLYESYDEYKDQPKALETLKYGQQLIDSTYEKNDFPFLTVKDEIAPLSLDDIEVEDPFERINAWEDQNTQLIQQETEDTFVVANKEKLLRGIARAAQSERRLLNGKDTLDELEERQQKVEDEGLIYGTGRKILGGALAGPAGFLGFEEAEEALTIRPKDEGFVEGVVGDIEAGAGFLGGMAASGAVGATAGSLVPGVGTAAGAVAGAGAFVLTNAVEAIMDAYDTAREAGATEGRALAASGVETISQGVQAALGGKAVVGISKRVLGKSLKPVAQETVGGVVAGGATGAAGSAISTVAQQVGEASYNFWDILENTTRGMVSGTALGGGAAFGVAKLGSATKPPPDKIDTTPPQAPPLPEGSFNRFGVSNDTADKLAVLQKTTDPEGERVKIYTDTNGFLVAENKYLGSDLTIKRTPQNLGKVQIPVGLGGAGDVLVEALPPMAGKFGEAVYQSRVVPKPTVTDPTSGAKVTAPNSAGAMSIYATQEMQRGRKYRLDEKLSERLKESFGGEEGPGLSRYWAKKNIDLVNEVDATVEQLGIEQAVELFLTTPKEYQTAELSVLGVKLVRELDATYQEALKAGNQIDAENAFALTEQVADHVVIRNSQAGKVLQAIQTDKFYANRAIDDLKQQLRQTVAKEVAVAESAEGTPVTPDQVKNVYKDLAAVQEKLDDLNKQQDPEIVRLDQEISDAEKLLKEADAVAQEALDKSQQRDDALIARAEAEIADIQAAKEAADAEIVDLQQKLKLAEDLLKEEVEKVKQKDAELISRAEKELQDIQTKKDDADLEAGQIKDRIKEVDEQIAKDIETAKKDDQEAVTEAKDKLEKIAETAKLTLTQIEDSLKKVDEQIAKAIDTAKEKDAALIKEGEAKLKTLKGKKDPQQKEIQALLKRLKERTYSPEEVIPNKVEQKNKLEEALRARKKGGVGDEEKKLRDFIKKIETKEYTPETVSPKKVKQKSKLEAALKDRSKIKATRDPKEVELQNFINNLKVKDYSPEKAAPKQTATRDKIKSVLDERRKTKATPDPRVQELEKFVRETKQKKSERTLDTEATKAVNKRRVKLKSVLDEKKKERAERVSKFDEASNALYQELTKKKGTLERRKKNYTEKLINSFKEALPEATVKRLFELQAALDRVPADSADAVAIKTDIERIRHAAAKTHMGKLKTLSSLLTTYYHAQLLFRLSTQAVNALYNLQQPFGTALSYGVTMGPGETLRYLADFTEGVGKYGINEFKRVFNEGAYVTKNTLELEYSRKQGELYSSKELAAPTVPEVRYETDPVRQLASIPKVGPAIKYLGYSLRALSAFDALFTKGAYEAEVAHILRTEARKQNLSGEAARRYVAERMFNSETDWKAALKEAEVNQKILEQAGIKRTKEDLISSAWQIMDKKRREDIRSDATYATGLSFLSQDIKPRGLTGMAFTFISKAFDAPWPIGKGRYIPSPLGIIQPFLGTILKVANLSLDWTPIGFGKATMGKFVIDETPSVVRRQLGSAVIGTTAMALMYGALKAHDDGSGDSWFDITTGIPTDPGKRAAFYKAGKKPWSIKMGDKYASYLTTPLVAPLAAIALLNDRRRNDKNFDEESMLQTAGTIMWGSMKAFSDLAVLRTTTSLLQAISKGEDVNDAGFTLLANITRNFGIPYVAVIDEIGRAYDNPVVTRNNFWAKVLKNTPLASYVGRPTLDIWGEPIKKEGIEAVPFLGSLAGRFVGLESNDENALWLVNNGYNIVGIEPRVVLRSEKPQYELIKQRRVKQPEIRETLSPGAIMDGALTDAEQYELQKRCGPQYKQVVESFRLRFGNRGFDKNIQKALTDRLSEIKSREKYNIFIKGSVTPYK